MGVPCFLRTRIGVWCLVATILPAAAQPQPREAAPPFFHEGATRLEQAGRLPKQRDAATAYRKWRARDAYFSAFAFGPSGQYGFTEGFNSRDMAEQSALAFCEQWDEPCRIAAVRVPDVTLPDDGAIIGSIAIQYYQSYLLRPTIRAFATAGNGASGWSWGHRTEAEAVARALELCGQQLAEVPAYLPQGTCEVIHVAR